MRIDERTLSTYNSGYVLSMTIDKVMDNLLPNWIFDLSSDRYYYERLMIRFLPSPVEFAAVDSSEPVKVPPRYLFGDDVIYFHPLTYTGYS